MTIEEARALIRGVEWRGSRPGLSRVRELLHRIGDPQDTLQFVHIAGTNGKGSTAAMLAAVLQAAGYTTGLFTSPFLEQFAERMQVNGQPIPDAELAAACETLQPCIAAMDDQPTEFELVTAAAMLWFQRRGCDIVVLEVGLGGRLDATNVIAAPACAVITNIGLDHTEILGDTLAQIAREKAGILKPGTRAVSYPQVPEGRAVLRGTCARLGIPLTEADADAIGPLRDSVDGQTFSYRGAVYDLPLLGRHQLRNAAVALETVAALRARLAHPGCGRARGAGAGALAGAVRGAAARAVVRARRRAQPAVRADGGGQSRTLFPRPAHHAARGRARGQGLSRSDRAARPVCRGLHRGDAALAARAAGGGAGGVFAALRETGDGLPRPGAGGGTRARAGRGGRCHLRGRLAVHGGRDPNLSAEGTR